MNLKSLFDPYKQTYLLIDNKNVIFDSPLLKTNKIPPSGKSQCLQIILSLDSVQR